MSRPRVKNKQLPVFLDDKLSLTQKIRFSSQSDRKNVLKVLRRLQFHSSAKLLVRPLVFMVAGACLILINSLTFGNVSAGLDAVGDRMLFMKVYKSEMERAAESLKEKLSERSAKIASLESELQSARTNSVSVSTRNVKIEPRIPIGGNWNGIGPEYLHKTFESRLGNQLFEFASGFGLAKKHNKILCVGRNMLGGIFVGPFPSSCPTDVRFTSLPDTEGPAGVSWADFPVGHGHFRIKGFVQRYVHFWRHKDELMKLFTFRTEVAQKAKAYLATVSGAGARTTVGIHIRLGDMPVKGAWLRHPPDSYFLNAMAHFRRRSKRPVVFVVTSENPAWCRRQKPFQSDDVHIVTAKNSAATDFAILSHCDHLIRSRGTFGWWAGLLTGGEVVYYDEEWDVKPSRHAFPEFYPPEWTAISADTSNYCTVDCY
eukprot:905415_1